MESSLIPLKWAQNKRLVFLTLEAKNLSEESRLITLTPEGHLSFSGKNQVTNQKYSLEISLFESVVTDMTKWKVTDFSVQFSICKANQDAEFWPRLTKEKVKMNNLAIDWTRWVDEDEVEDQPEANDQADYENLPGGYGDGYDDEDEDEDEEADLGDLEDELPNQEKNESPPSDSKEEPLIGEAPKDEALKVEATEAVKDEDPKEEAKS